MKLNFFLPFLLFFMGLSTFFYLSQENNTSKDIFKTSYTWELTSDQHLNDLQSCSQLLLINKNGLRK